jgi:hypothetical protein
MIEKTKNTNCLAGMKCPECSSLGPFRITGEASFLVTDDGTEEFGDTEWTDLSSCMCAGCSFAGHVEDFIIPETKQHPENPIEPQSDKALDDSRDYALAPDCTGIWLTVKKMSVHVFRTDEGVAVDFYPVGYEMDGAMASAYVFDSEAEEAIEEGEEKDVEGLHPDKAEEPTEQPVPRTDEPEPVITEEEAERCKAEHRAELLGLKQYDVTVRAIVTKTYRVDAKDEDEAVEEAHCVFSVLNDEVPEDYNEETLNVEEAKPE